MRKNIALILLLILITLTGCNSEEQDTAEITTANDKLSVYTTVYPLQYFTKEIGKEYVEVETIYPPGADEHIYEPSQRDMIKLADSDLFIYVGLGLEGFVNKAEQTLTNENVRLLAAGENIKGIEHGHEDEDDHAHEEEDHEHHHGDVDPHVWIDPIYAKDLAEAIKNELADMLPEHESEFEENYRELASKLDQLNEKFINLAENTTTGKIVVSHAAYGYWEKRYGIEQMSISGLASSSEPTQKELKQIISEAKKHNIKYVFFEQNVNSRLVETVQEEMNAQALQLHNLSVLTDEDIKNERNYFSIMEDNLKALEEALIE